MADESVLSPIDALKIIENRAADIVGIKIAPLGGIERAQRILDLCRTAGIPCCLGSMLDLDVISAAEIHLLLSQPALDQPTGILYPFASVSIIKSPPSIQTGEYTVGEELSKIGGLGVEFDEDVIETHQIFQASYQ